MLTKQNRIAKILAVIMLLAVLVFAFASCEESSKTGFCTIVVGTDTPTEYKVNLDKVEVKEGLISILNYLKEEGKLDYKSNDSGYGAYLTEVGDIKEDSANGIYVYIWTSAEKDFDVSQYATTKEYNGKTLTSSGVGASSMTIEDGVVVYIGTIKY